MMADEQRNGLSEEALDRIKFSFSSKNAENVVAPCLVQVFVSEDHSGPISWQHVTTGVVALLRSRESTRKGWIWNISVAIADRFHGMCVWRDKLSRDSNYTILSDNFHVFAVSDIQAITSFVFDSAEEGRTFGETYKQWIREKLKEDGFKGKIQTGPRFRRDMISRPCNFLHISGSAALAQIQQMEDAKQAVGKVISTIGPRRTVSLDHIDGVGGGGKRNKRKEQVEVDWPSRFEHMNLPMPRQQTGVGLNLTYSQEPAYVRGSTPTVSIPDSIPEQPVQSNGVNHSQYNGTSDHMSHNSSVSAIPPQQQTQQQYDGQQQQLNYSQQQNYYEPDVSSQHHDPYQQHQVGYHNHQSGHATHQDQHPVQPVAEYMVEDIGYDYDDGVASEPTEDVWRESVMEGTNWEDEVLKAWSMHTGNTKFASASEYL